MHFLDGYIFVDFLVRVLFVSLAVYLNYSTIFNKTPLVYLNLNTFFRPEQDDLQGQFFMQYHQDGTIHMYKILRIEDFYLLFVLQQLHFAKEDILEYIVIIYVNVHRSIDIERGEG